MKIKKLSIIVAFCSISPVFAYSGEFHNLPSNGTVLKQNTGSGKNVLTQAMMTKGDRTYVIKYDYDLNGGTIIVPDNCTLRFAQGGKIGNGTIKGNNTKIIASRKKKIFSDDIIIDGTWIVRKIYVDWIDIPDKNSCGPQVRNILKLQNDNVSQIVYFPKYNIAYDPLPTTENDPRARTLIELTSNTRLIIPARITVNTNRLEFYEVIYCFGKKNIEISGGGEIVGDVRTHIYDAPSEYGHGMRCIHCNNVTIRDMTFKECIGDGFCTSGLGPADSEYDFSKGCINLSLVNCIFDSNRRQGVSLTCAQDGLLINKCQFLNTGKISSTSPTAGIDFEPNGDYDTYQNCVIKNSIFKNNVGAQFCTYRANFDGLFIDNCQFIAPCEVVNGVSQLMGTRSISLHGTFKNAQISNSTLNSYLTTEKFKTSNSSIKLSNCDLKGFYSFDMVTSGPIERCYTIEFNRCVFDIDKVNYRYAPFFIRNATTDLVFNKCKIVNQVDIQTNFGNLFIYRSGYGSYAKFEAYDSTIDLNDKPTDFTLLKNCTVRCSNISCVITKLQGVVLFGNKFELTSANLSEYFRLVNAVGLNEDGPGTIRIENNTITSSASAPSRIISGENVKSRYATTGYDLYFVGNTLPYKIDMDKLQSIDVSNQFRSVTIKQ